MKFKIGPERLDQLNHVNYLQFQMLAEIARANFMESKGIGVASLLEKGLAFFIRKVDVTYRQQLFLGDEVDVTMDAEVKRDRFIYFTSRVIKGSQTVADIRFLMVLVDGSTGTTAKMPPWLKDLLAPS